MEGLGMDEGDGEGNILPIMQSIMQNLLSKDVLYPSLREITEKVCPRLRRAHSRGPVCPLSLRTQRSAQHPISSSVLGLEDTAGAHGGRGAARPVPCGRLVSTGLPALLA